MDVILLEKVRNLGNLGDKVSVKPGYGRNYLIPKGKAASANAENIAKLEARRAELERLANERLAVSQQHAEVLKGKIIKIAARAGDEGRLFGSVGTSDIVNAIKVFGINIRRSEVTMPLGVIRQIGDYDVDVQLHSEVTTRLTVSVVAE